MAPFPTKPVRYSTKLKTLHIAAYDADGPRIEGPEDAVRVARAILAELDGDREHFVVMAMSSRSRITGFHRVSTGTVDHVVVHAREVFKAAIMLSAAKVVLAHNHPSGDPSPSEEDVRLTAQLADAGDLLGIPLVDHVIVAGLRSQSIAPATARAFVAEADRRQLAAADRGRR